MDFTHLSGCFISKSLKAAPFFSKHFLSSRAGRLWVCRLCASVSLSGYPSLTLTCLRLHFSQTDPQISIKCLNCQQGPGPGPVTALWKKEISVRNRCSQHLAGLGARPLRTFPNLDLCRQRVIMDVVGYIRKQQQRRRKQDPASVWLRRS